MRAELDPSAGAEPDRPTGAGLGALALGLALAVLASPTAAGALWGALAGDGDRPFPGGRLLELAASHGLIALLALGPAAALGVGFGLLVTRPAGLAWRPLVDAAAAASQAVPPVVVVALAFPVLGFGAAPTVLALAAYCLMPVLRATVAAVEGVPPAVREAARAMGLTPRQVLWQVEAPLALPVIGAGLRVALVLAVATTAVGALAGASTLGTPIVLGLRNGNELAILQGAAATASLAFLAEGSSRLAAAVLRRARA